MGGEGNGRGGEGEVQVIADSAIGCTRLIINPLERFLSVHPPHAKGERREAKSVHCDRPP